MFTHFIIYAFVSLMRMLMSKMKYLCSGVS